MDKLKKLSRKWVGQIGAAGVTDAVGTTIPLSSTTNLATDTAVVATIDRVDANGVKTPTLEESVIGVVSGSNLSTCVRGAEGTAQAHAAGAVVEILVTAKGYNDIIDHLLVEHTQLGVHTSAMVTSLKATGAVVNTGTSDVTIVTPKAIADSYISALPTATSTTTFTNKRNQKRVYSTTSLATLTPEIDTYDIFKLTAQAEALTIANHSTSTPANGEMMLIDIVPDATPRAITHGTNYVSGTGTLLTTTTASKRSDELFIWDSAVSKWVCMTAQTAA